MVTAAAAARLLLEGKRSKCSASADKRDARTIATGCVRLVRRGATVIAAMAATLGSDVAVMRSKAEPKLPHFVSRMHTSRFTDERRRFH